jgi:hypothetical protein
MRRELLGRPGLRTILGRQRRVHATLLRTAFLLTWILLAWILLATDRSRRAQDVERARQQAWSRLRLIGWWRFRVAEAAATRIRLVSRRRRLAIVRPTNTIAWIAWIARIARIGLVGWRLVVGTPHAVTRIARVARIRLVGRRLIVRTPDAAARITRIDRLVTWNRRLAVTTRRRQLVGLDVLRVAAPILRARTRRAPICRWRVIGRRIVLGLDRRRRLERRALLLERRQREKLRQRRRAREPQRQPDDGGSRA